MSTAIRPPAFDKDKFVMVQGSVSPGGNIGLYLPMQPLPAYVPVVSLPKAGAHAPPQLNWCPLNFEVTVATFPELLSRMSWQFERMFCSMFAIDSVNETPTAPRNKSDQFLWQFNAELQSQIQSHGFAAGSAQQFVSPPANLRTYWLGSPENGSQPTQPLLTRLGLAAIVSKARAIPGFRGGPRELAELLLTYAAEGGRDTGIPTEPVPA